MPPLAKTAGAQGFRSLQSPDTRLDSIARVEREALTITDRTGLTAWIQGSLRALIPHQKALIGFGQVGYSKSCVDCVHMVDLDETYFAAIQSCTRELSSPVMTNWLERRVPQLFARSDFCQIRHDRWLNNLDEHGIVNGVFDATVDCLTGRICFVTLFNLAQVPNACANVLTQCVTPMLADIWRRVDTRAPSSKISQLPVPSFSFSPAEREVLAWVGAGKTNWEIAQILGKSECTVKNQVAKMLSRSGATTRSQLAMMCVEN